MDIYISAQKIKKLLTNFLQNEISVDEFRYKFLDLYEYEIEKFIPQTEIEEDIKQLLDDYYGDIRSYSPYKEDHKHGLLNLDQLTGYTNILLVKLKGYFLGTEQIDWGNKRLDKNFSLNLEKLLYIFNAFFYLKLEKEELINQISYIFISMIAQNEFEKEILQYINNNLINLKINLNDRNKFLENLRKMKRKIYDYLQ